MKDTSKSLEGNDIWNSINLNTTFLAHHNGMPELRAACDKYKKDIKVVFDSKNTSIVNLLRQIKDHNQKISWDFKEIIDELEKGQVDDPKLYDLIAHVKESLKNISTDLRDFLTDLEGKLDAKDGDCFVDDGKNLVIMKDSFAEWRGKIQQFKSNLKNLKHQVTLYSSLVSIKDTFASKEEELQQCMKNKTLLEDQCAANRNVISKHEDMTTKLEARITELRSDHKEEIATMEQKLNEKLKENTSCKMENKELMMQVDQLKNVNEQFHKEIDMLTQTRQTQENDIELMNIEVEREASRMKEKDDEIGNLKRLREVDIANAVMLQRTIDSLTNDVQNLNLENEALKSKKRGQDGNSGDDQSSLKLMNGQGLNREPPSVAVKQIIENNVPNPAEAEQLIYAVNTLKREELPELVKTEEELDKLSSDELRALLSNREETKFVEMREKLMDLEAKINLVLSKNKHSNNKLARHVVMELEDKRKECEELRYEVKHTKVIITKVTQCKNIKIIIPDHKRRESSDQVEIPKFNGDNRNLDIYQFITLCRSYLKFHSIADDEAGEEIRKLISGHARKVFENKFKLQCNPNLQEIYNFLVERYGNIKRILQDIGEMHKDVGQMAPSEDYLKLSDEEIKEMHQRAGKHISLFERVQLIREYKNGDSGKIDFDGYKKVILSILPNDKCRELILTTPSTIDHIMMTIEDILKGTQRYLFYIIQEDLTELRMERRPMDTEVQIFENEETPRSSYMTQVTKFKAVNQLQTKSVLHADIYMKEVEVESCQLCSHMKTVYNMESQTKRHGVSTKKDGSSFVLVITCPFLIELDMKAKSDFLQQHKYCRSCLLMPTGPHHTEEKCSYSGRYHINCMKKRCNYLYYLCSQHRNLNDERIMKKYKALSDAGINCNY